MAADETMAAGIASLSIEEKFRRFAVKGLGTEPDTEMVKMFMELLAMEPEGAE
jgi:hypothetical protein